VAELHHIEIFANLDESHLLRRNGNERISRIGLDPALRAVQYIRNGYIHGGWNMTKKAPEEPRDPNRFLPLTPAIFHIMLALAGGEGHGYGIMLEVERLTSGQLNLGPGTLYRSIQRMLLDGFIEEMNDAQESEQDDERRRYYRLTRFGFDVAREEARRLEALVIAARERKLLR
jgi:DNA-binding PadR family transcriptional regulator